ncbi:hypothetical protein [Pseudaestuariivita atlantica]|uniref:Uncharacterized protein n=1 Tax=Pseudaestuariivita atlantica TaxID=1317121 RepID=A0A0L1JS26_9RHOB|nr:hypothetical protein [Pseudaestuariivita atlantica]KNG94536.1 hypothetical protein ATO11_03755 [Pseudaestuariivita atlantica]
MKHVLALCLALAASIGSAEAACYAEYKAKRDNPLQLHYGILQLPSDAACRNQQRAGAVIERRIGRDGWTLLSVMSLSTTPPSAEQRSNAGQYYLRY